MSERDTSRPEARAQDCERIERHERELRAKSSDLGDIRGLLSPNGYPPVVPMELGDRVAPAIEWLIRDRAEARAALDEAQEWQNSLTVHIPEVYEASEGSQESVIDQWAADAAGIMALAKRWYRGDPNALVALADAVKQLPDTDDDPGEARRPAVRRDVPAVGAVGSGTDREVDA